MTWMRSVSGAVPSGGSPLLREEHGRQSLVSTARHHDGSHLHPNIARCVAVQFLNQTMTAVVLGALFDTYLKLISGTNTFVGNVEAIRGMTTLAIALPLGFVVDRWPNASLLKLNTATLMVFAACLVGGIFTDTTALVIVAAIISGVANQTFVTLIPVLLASMTSAGDARNQAISMMSMGNSLGSACGPALQIMFMLSFGMNSWSMSKLHVVMSSGVLLLLPIACVVWSIRGECASHTTELVQASEEGGSRGWFVAAIVIEASSFVVSIGSGMTFKFWPLFFANDFDLSPVAVCFVQFGMWLTIFSFVSLSPALARRLGRLQVCFMLQTSATCLLFIIACTKLSLELTVALVLLRNGLMNAATPLIQSAVLDLVPKEHRGKWTSISSLRRASWSGSAFIGGWLSDFNDYRFAFMVTAYVHSVPCLIMFSLALLERWRK